MSKGFSRGLIQRDDEKKKEREESETFFLSIINDKAFYLPVYLESLWLSRHISCQVNQQPGAGPNIAKCVGGFNMK
jgi:hypothetical protein